MKVGEKVRSTDFQAQVVQVRRHGRAPSRARAPRGGAAAADGEKMLAEAAGLSRAARPRTARAGCARAFVTRSGRLPAMSIAPRASACAPADVEAWLAELGLTPIERADREGVTSWDLVLDGTRRAAPPDHADPRPALALVCWAHYAPPIDDAFRKSYRRLLRWNDELPFVKFSVGEDERPLLVVEIPVAHADRDALGLALARELAVADRLHAETRPVAQGGRLAGGPAAARATWTARACGSSPATRPSWGAAGAPEARRVTRARRVARPLRVRAPGSLAAHGPARRPRRRRAGAGLLAPPATRGAATDLTLVTNATYTVLPGATAGSRVARRDHRPQPHRRDEDPEVLLRPRVPRRPAGRRRVPDRRRQGRHRPGREDHARRPAAPDRLRGRLYSGKSRGVPAHVQPAGARARAPTRRSGSGRASSRCRSGPSRPTARGGSSVERPLPRGLGRGGRVRVVRAARDDVRRRHACSSTGPARRARSRSSPSCPRSARRSYVDRAVAIAGRGRRGPAHPPGLGGRPRLGEADRRAAGPGAARAGRGHRPARGRTTSRSSSRRRSSREASAYAGLFDPAANRIEVAYWASDAVALHEAAHAWFNGSLVADRWATRGSRPGTRSAPAARARGRRPRRPELDGGPAPGRDPARHAAADGRAPDRRGAYGYAASYELARQLAERVGPEALAAAWAAAAERRGAYQPPTRTRPARRTPSRVAGPPDWRGLLDLFEARPARPSTDLFAHLGRDARRGAPSSTPAPPPARRTRGRSRSPATGRCRAGSATRCARGTSRRPSGSWPTRGRSSPSGNALEAIAARDGIALPERPAGHVRGRGPRRRRAPGPRPSGRRSSRSRTAARHASVGRRPAEPDRDAGRAPRADLRRGASSCSPQGDLRGRPRGRGPGAARVDRRLGGGPAARAAGDRRARHAARARRGARRHRPSQPAPPAPDDGPPQPQAGRRLTIPGTRATMGPDVATTAPRGPAAPMPRASVRRPAALAACSPCSSPSPARCSPPRRRRSRSRRPSRPPSPAPPPTTSRSRRPPATSSIPRAPGPRRRRHHRRQPQARRASRGADDHPLLLRRRQPRRPARGEARPRDPGRRAGPGQGGASATATGWSRVLFRDNLYFEETAKVRLAFDLPAGAPRSDSDVRVGEAFATFMAWAFGDRGHGPGRGAGELPGRPRRATRWSARSGPAGTAAWTARARQDPLGWYAWVNATNDDALTRDRLTLADGEEVVIRGWPEDRRVAGPRPRAARGRRARARVADRAATGRSTARCRSPRSTRRCSRATPGSTTPQTRRDHDQRGPGRPDDRPRGVARLVQQARCSPSAGSREGLADEYAARVLEALGRKRPGPDPRQARRRRRRSRSRRGRRPAPIRDDGGDAREQYGYDASWTVMRRIVERVGEAGMRELFAAAAAGTTAYPGEGAPERSQLANDWRRFLDLAEELGGGDGRSRSSITPLGPAPRTTAEPARRRAPRRATAYAELVEAGGTLGAAARPCARRWTRWRLRGRRRTQMEAATAVLDAPRRDRRRSPRSRASCPRTATEDRYQDADSESELAVLGGRPRVEPRGAPGRSRRPPTPSRRRATGSRTSAWTARTRPRRTRRPATRGRRATWPRRPPARGRRSAMLAAAPEAGPDPRHHGGRGDRGRDRAPARCVVLIVARWSASARPSRRPRRGHRPPRRSPLRRPRRRRWPYATLPPDGTPAEPPAAPSPGDEGAPRP